MSHSIINKILPVGLKKEIYQFRLNGLEGYLSLHWARKEYESLNSDPDSNVFRYHHNVSIRYYPEFKRHLENRFLNSLDQLEEYRTFLDLCEGKKLLMDVGAGRGLFSLGFCGLTGKTAYAFEPSPFMRDGLEQNVQLNPDRDVRVVPIALGTGNGEVDMGLNREGQLSSHLNKQATQGLTVQTTSLDQFVLENDLEPDCVKIDVEGYESEVLKGACNCLNQYKPLIFLEVHIDFLAKRGTPLKNVFDCILENGYNVYLTNLKQIDDPVRYCKDLKAKRGKSVTHLVCSA